MHFTPYIGIPFADKGMPDTLDEAKTSGANCWGLVRLVYRELGRLSLPAYTEGYTSSSLAHVKEFSPLIAQGIRTFTEIERLFLPVEGEKDALDIVVFQMGKEFLHIGVAVDHKYFLHVMSDIVASLDRFDKHYWQQNMVGVYRAR